MWDTLRDGSRAGGGYRAMQDILMCSRYTGPLEYRALRDIMRFRVSGHANRDMQIQNRVQYRAP
jgi:hypothetical protein